MDEEISFMKAYVYEWTDYSAALEEAIERDIEAANNLLSSMMEV